jgi:hypothetical protein
MTIEKGFMLVNLIGFGVYIIVGFLKEDIFALSIALVYLILAKWFWEVEKHGKQ